MEIVVGMIFIIVLYFLISILVNGITISHLKSKGIEIEDIDENVLLGRFLFWFIYLFTRIVKLIRYMTYYTCRAFYAVITDWK